MPPRIRVYPYTPCNFKGHLDQPSDRCQGEGVDSSTVVQGSRFRVLCRVGDLVFRVWGLGPLGPAHETLHATQLLRV